MTGLTTDALFDGRLQIRQPRSGYRFSIDAVLLGHLAAPRPKDRVIELGAGCGVVSVILAHRNAGAWILGVELQPALAAVARENVRRNGFESRIEILEGDLRLMGLQDTGGAFDLMVCNPPYRRSRSGRINPDPQKAVARHEIAVNLSDVVAAAGRLLKRSGRLSIIYPAERSADLIAEMRAGGVEPKHLRTIHSRIDAEAKLVFVEGRRHGRPGIHIAPPLAIYDAGGGYGPEVAAMLA